MTTNLDNLNDQKKNSPTLHLLKQQLGGGGAHGKPVDGGADANTSSPQAAGDGKSAPPPAAETPKATKQQVLGPDRLHDAAHQIEKLADEATAVAKVHALIDEQGFNFYQLGGVLQVMREKKWFLGHQTFGELCEEEFGFSRRKAEYLVSIYNFILDAELTWEQFKTVGWTKLRVIAQRVEPKAALPWIEKAGTTTVKELQKTLNASVAGADSVDGGGGSPVKTLVFKPHEDQLEGIRTALDKAKKEFQTEYDTVALEHICMTFLSPGASQPKSEAPPVGSAVAAPKPGQDGYVWPSVKAMYQHLLAEHDGDLHQTMKALFDAFGDVFPSVDVTVKIT